ncbi:hypothetical protein ACFQXA_15635 [Nocardiopsis composta]
MNWQLIAAAAVGGGLSAAGLVLIAGAAPDLCRRAGEHVFGAGSAAVRRGCWRWPPASPPGWPPGGWWGPCWPRRRPGGCPACSGRTGRCWRRPSGPRLWPPGPLSCAT